MLCTQVLASFINPGGLIPKDFEAASAGSETCYENEDSEQSSLPALLPELLTQSCLVPALSSYLRNDSGAVLSCCYTYMLMDVRIHAVEAVHESVLCCSKIPTVIIYTFCQ